MATKRDFYEVLGVGKSANADELKKALAPQQLKFSYNFKRNLNCEERRLS